MSRTISEVQRDADILLHRLRSQPILDKDNAIEIVKLIADLATSVASLKTTSQAARIASESDVQALKNKIAKTTGGAQTFNSQSSRPSR